MSQTCRIIGIDPGLRKTGWGIIDCTSVNKYIYVASGQIAVPPDLGLPKRLEILGRKLEEVIEAHHPMEAAVEETFVNKNPTSTLKLGQARGVLLMIPSRMGLSVSEYTANKVKKSVVGAGHAAKNQVEMMVKFLLPGVTISSADEADALAIALCHAHHRLTLARIGAA